MKADGVRSDKAGSLNLPVPVQKWYALTGYEGSKADRNFPFNVYNALAGLAEKGAAYLMEAAAVSIWLFP